MVFEKVTITKCDPIINGQAHGVTLSDGRTCTAWNDKINSGLLMQHFSSHQPLLMEIKPYVSKAGKEGLNIVAIGEDTTPAVMQEKVAEAPQETKGLLMSTRDQSIIAQVFVKGAVELAKGESWKDNDELQDFLKKAVGNLAEAYKEALSQLD